MSNHLISYDTNKWPTLVQFPVSAKALVTAIILAIGIALLGTLGQIIVHDIVPTFFQKGQSALHEGPERQTQEGNRELPPARGDLFSDLSGVDEKTRTLSFYQDEQFIWLLKWTHIHLFGMSMIFIFMGGIAIFLNMNSRKRTWLVVAPFVGIYVDISAMWFKAYISEAFFWLHIPGGGLFMATYLFISIRALIEMWLHFSRG